MAVFILVLNRILILALCNNCFELISLCEIFPNLVFCDSNPFHVEPPKKPIVQLEPNVLIDSDEESQTPRIDQILKYRRGIYTNYPKMNESVSRH